MRITDGIDRSSERSRRRGPGSVDELGAHLPTGARSARPWGPTIDPTSIAGAVIRWRGARIVVRMPAHVVVRPLTAARWNDFAALFGERGACGGCWCMLWRLPRRTFDAQKGDGNRDAMRALVDAGEEPGLLGYRGREPIGWVSLGPRPEFEALERSRILKPIDAQPVWSITCLFVAKAHRRTGVSRALLEAAAAHVRRRGGAIVEGYPQEPKRSDMADVFAWTGIASAFRSAGFREVARPSPTRPIMRREL
jgi:GNAT superfamily N-acetyltransferase